MEKTFIAHLRDIDQPAKEKDRREATVVGIWDSELERLSIGIAVKNPRDRNYNKAMGVEIATGRARKRPNFTLCTRQWKPDEVKRDIDRVIDRVFDSQVKTIRHRLEKKWAKGQGAIATLFSRTEGSES
jgi:hypothetical protein